MLLTQTLFEAVRNLVTLHDREAAHVADSGSPLDRFDLALKVARRRRTEAKHALLAHLREHG